MKLPRVGQTIYIGWEDSKCQIIKRENMRNNDVGLFTLRSDTRVFNVVLHSDGRTIPTSPYDNSVFTLRYLRSYLHQRWMFSRRKAITYRKRESRKRSLESVAARKRLESYIKLVETMNAQELHWHNSCVLGMIPTKIDVISVQLEVMSKPRNNDISSMRILKERTPNANSYMLSYELGEIHDGK